MAVALESLFGFNAVTSALRHRSGQLKRLHLLARRDGASRRDDELRRLAAARNVPVSIHQSRNYLQKMVAPFAQTQGVVLEAEPIVARRCASDAADLLRSNSGPSLTVFLDRITDAHNVGAVARSSAFFGVRQVLVSSGCAPLGPTTAAAAAGAVDTLQWMHVEARDLLQWREQGRVELVAAVTPRAPRAVSLAQFLSQTNTDSNRVRVLMLGSERGGLRKRLCRSEHVHNVFLHGGDGQLDSLNVAAAAAIFLHAFAAK